MTSKPNNDIVIPKGPSHASDSQAGAPAPASLSSASAPTAPQDKAAAMQEEVLIRKKKRKRRKAKKNHKIAIVIAVIVVLVAAGFGGAFALFNSGQNTATSVLKSASVSTGAGATSGDEGKTVSYNGHTYKLNDNMVSILFVGHDDESKTRADQPEQADAVMVAAIDTKTGKTTIIGVPRDTMCDVETYGLGNSFGGANQLQLCLAYGYGDTPQACTENVSRAVTRILYGIPMTYYISIDEDAIAELNDAIGGVALTPIQSVPKANVVEGEYTVLLGKRAHDYVQYRDTSYLTSSLDRQARQVQYLRAFTDQVLSNKIGALGTMTNLFNIAMQYSTTNIGVADFTYLASTLVNNGITDVQITTLSGEMKQGETYAEFYVDDKAAYETVLNTYYTRVD